MQHCLGFITRDNEENKCTQVLKSDVYDSFKFIVNPRTKGIEITSFLQYCALKNTLSKLTSNNIKPFRYSNNNMDHVYFIDKNKNFNQDVSFTEYIQKRQSEKNDLKTKYFNDTGTSSLFFDAISEIEYTGSFRDLRPIYEGVHEDDYVINDLYIIFMNHEYAKKYLSKYIPKNSEEVCYVETYEFLGCKISYKDDFIRFFHHWCRPTDFETNDEGYTRIIDCIDGNINFQISKNNGHIENTYDELCIYTEDPTIIHKVLMNNQVIIDTMASDISYINDKRHDEYSRKSIVYNELQTSIANVIETYESTKKEVEDKLTVLKGLFS